MTSGATASRHLRMVAYDPSYEPKGRLGDPCIYCGVVSDTMDHVPPLAFVKSCALTELDPGNLYKYPGRA